VDVSVSEVDIEQIQTGQPVTITLDALQGKSYQGTVSEVSQISTDTGSSVNFTITVHVTDADKAVRPGMTAEVSIVTASKSNALLVPLQAVIQQDGKSVVYQVQTPISRATGSQQASQAGANIVGGYQTVTVTLGITSDSYAEVASGDLKAGDQVVINPDQLQGTLSSSSQSTRGGFGMFGMLGGMGGPPPDGGGPRQNNNSSSSSKSSSGSGASGGAQGGG
jgi:HlyD family secretion protein